MNKTGNGKKGILLLEPAFCVNSGIKKNIHWTALLTFTFALSLAGCKGCGRPTDPLLVAENKEHQQNLTHKYRLVEIVSGLDHPWALAFLPNGDMLITERAGQIRLVRDGKLLEEVIPGGPEVWAQGQGGLLDIVPSPDYESNQLIYFSYSKPLANGEATTALARARFDDDRFHELEDIFVADAAGGRQHFGSRIVFDHNGMLFLSIGERGKQQPAQDLSNHIGTTVRLHADGSVPDDNPFVDSEGARKEIFTYGHRNQQGMAVHPETGEVWQNEHGPKGGDEINLIQAGANYGWPLASEGDHYDGEPIPSHDASDDFEKPLSYWTPSIGVSGMAFYTGELFPNWRGSSFHGALAARHLRRVVFNDTELVHEEILLEEFGERIRDVRNGPDGYIYILTDSSNGVLARIEPQDEG